MWALMQEMTVTCLGWQRPFPDSLRQLHPFLAAKPPLAQPRNEYIVEATCCSLRRVESEHVEAACHQLPGDAASFAAVCALGVASTYVASPTSPSSPVLEVVVYGTVPSEVSVAEKADAAVDAAVDSESLIAVVSADALVSGKPAAAAADLESLLAMGSADALAYGKSAAAAAAASGLALPAALSVAGR